MFDSIKPWINVTYQIKPFVKRNGAGTKQYGDVISSKCYPVDDTKLVTNNEGTEVTSNAQLYVDGSEPIKVTDDVIFNGEERPILHIGSYYRNGVVDLKVVYL